VDVAADQQIVKNRGVFEQFDILKRTGNSQVDHLVSRQMGDIFTFKGDPTFGQIVYSADDVENRRFAGPVGPYDGKDRPHFHIKTDAIDRFDAAEIYGDVLRLQNYHCTRSVFR
jgi:hypothetical protein